MFTCDKECEYDEQRDPSIGLNPHPHVTYLPLIMLYNVLVQQRTLINVPRITLNFCTNVLHRNLVLS